IETHLRSQFVIALATIIFGVLLGVADRWPRMNQLQSNSGVTLPCAFLIGLAQATALIPGTSRSGVTMTAALLLGLGRVEAARFSFLLSIPIIAGAGLFQMLKVSSTPDAMEWSVFAWGVVLSGISAYFCIRLFLASIERMGMMPFVLYRLLLGTVLLLV
ncbi:MAG: undecaprenyl-diphosphate phosphatase, partial [Gammaproteobacteria bacterium]